MPSVGQLLNMSPEYRSAAIATFPDSVRLRLVRLANYGIVRGAFEMEQYRKLIHELTEETNGTPE